MNAVEFVLLVQKRKPLHVPGDMAGVCHDLEIFHGSNEPPPLLLEISLVGKRQRRVSLAEHIQRELRRRFTFEEGLVLNDEDRVPVESGALHMISSGAAKRKLPEAGAISLEGPRCPEESINPHIATRRDDRHGRQSPQSWGGLGAAYCRDIRPRMPALSVIHVADLARTPSR